jgi:hypothetical protein
VRIQHGPATVTGDESRHCGPLSIEDGKAAASRMIQKSGYHKYARLCWKAILLDGNRAFLRGKVLDWRCAR